MKPKQDNVCHTCRNHKIGCDGKRPCCSQCRLTGRQCEGYQLSAVFVAYSPESSTAQFKRAKNPVVDHPASDPRSLVVNYNSSRAYTAQLRKYSVPRPISVVPLNGFATVIVQSFTPREKQNMSPFDFSTSQVCGAWVTILPRLAHDARTGELVSSAIRALGTALLDRSQPERTTDYRSLEAYTSLMKQLRNSLIARDAVFGIEIAVAMLCLAFVEFVMPMPYDSFFKHLKGLGALIQSQEPHIFMSDFAHAFFIGCRPIIIFQALQERKPTFLAQHRWKVIPFRNRQASDMQNLLSDVSTLPSILDELDSLLSLPLVIGMSKYHAIWSDLLKVHCRLLEWATRLENARESRLSSTRHLDVTYPFAGLQEANVNIHLWAFRIICVTEMKRLGTYMSFFGNGRPETNRIVDESLQASELAAKIFANIEYVLQDEMELYGPVSALFPLQVAHNLYQNMDGQEKQIGHCQHLLARIRNRGISGWPRLPAMPSES